MKMRHFISSDDVRSGRWLYVAVLFLYVILTTGGFVAIGVLTRDNSKESKSMAVKVIPQRGNSIYISAATGISND